ncbi:MAG: hypothetical protein HYZ49_13390 [Chloroflexi bacterium]|nr:hypothetical protein [Chloroflexota bacterium]
MKQTLFQRLLAAFAVFTLLLLPLQARAHDGDPRVEISSDRLQPGLVLEVRGVNIAADEPITVSLVGAAGEFPLGVATGDGHGDFTQPFTVPVDMPEGTYKVLAQSSNLPVASAPIVVYGPPVLEAEGEGELREEEEALLAPMPTFPKAQASAPTPQPATSGAPPPSPSPALVFGGLALVVLGLVAIFRRMQSPAQREKS